jgi:hypothetical protein
MLRLICYLIGTEQLEMSTAVLIHTERVFEERDRLLGTPRL